MDTVTPLLVIVLGGVALSIIVDDWHVKSLVSASSVKGAVGTGAEDKPTPIRYLKLLI